jgi:hypothetical protein
MNRVHTLNNTDTQVLNGELVANHSDSPRERPGAGVLSGLKDLRTENELQAEARQVLAKRRDELILSGRELGLSTYAMAKSLGQTPQALRFRFEILDAK